ILENGLVYAEGGAKEITETYHNLLFGGNENQSFKQKKDRVEGEKDDDLNREKVGINQAGEGEKENKLVRYGTGEAVMESWGIYNEDDNPVSVIKSGEPFKFEIQLT
ncbi:MAG: hypothetical protein GTO02_14670, partial [Candidatus Dadabacteria bacterium]|nr:hypothetical protein [Candidatus Dadabacteria bacterium]